MGKGSKRRPEDKEAIASNWDRIFNKSKGSPEILRKGGPMKDKTKYDRKDQEIDYDD